MDNVPSGTDEDYRGALKDINGDSPFNQPRLTVVEEWLQVADKQRRLAGRGYDGDLWGGWDLMDYVRQNIESR